MRARMIGGALGLITAGSLAAALEGCFRRLVGHGAQARRPRSEYLESL